MESSSSRADPARLKRHVHTLAYDLVPRDADHPEHLAPVASYVEAQLVPYTERLTDQPYSVDATTRRNVISRFGPEAGARIVIGAHYDTAGPYAGADENERHWAREG